MPNVANAFVRLPLNHVCRHYCCSIEYLRCAVVVPLLCDVTDRYRCACSQRVSDCQRRSSRRSDCFTGTLDYGPLSRPPAQCTLVASVVMIGLGTYVGGKDDHGCLSVRPLPSEPKFLTIHHQYGRA